MYDCIDILTEFRTGGGAFLVIQCSCKKWKKLTIIIVRKDEEQVLLVVPYWPNRTWFPKLMLLATSPSLANSSEEGSPFSERGHPLAPMSRLVESQCSHREDPRRCPIRVVLSFLQDGLERRRSPSTLKVYVAAIAAHHDAVDGKFVGKHDLVIRFLRGARRLINPRPHLVLPLVLAALRGEPFEPLQSVELKFLSFKTVLRNALASVMRVGDLHAFLIDDSCLEFGLADSHVILRPRPGYVPKVPTTPFRDQVVNLQALHMLWFPWWSCVFFHSTVPLLVSQCLSLGRLRSSIPAGVASLLTGPETAETFQMLYCP